MSSAARNSLAPALALALALGLPPGPATAADDEDGAAAGEPGVRAVGGTSIIGNRELPKSLYIVPWKNSEVGLRTDLSRDLLDEGLTPIDPNEFQRQVDYYEFHQQQR